MSLPGIDQLITWARDYKVENLPSSTANLPGKREFRAAIIQLGKDIAAAGSGTNPKANAVFATTGNINLATDLVAGNVFDGVVAVAGKRALVWMQDNQAQNGLYIVAASGAAARASDADTAAEITQMSVIVEAGASYGMKQFQLFQPDPITLGVTALPFAATVDYRTIIAMSGNTTITSPDQVIVNKTDTSKKLLTFLRSGVASLMSMRFSRIATRRDVMAWVDNGRRTLARINQDGRFICRPALGDAQAAVRAGARGVPMLPQDNAESTTYLSDVNNGLGLAPYSYRRNAPSNFLKAHPITASRKVVTFIDHGQSWRGPWGTPAAQYQNLGLQELVFMLRNRWGSLPTTYFPSYVQKLRDIQGVRLENAGGTNDDNAAPDVNQGGSAEIGMVATLAFQKLCALGKDPIAAALNLGQPQGGSSWSEAYKFGPDLWIAPGSQSWAAMKRCIDQAPVCLAPYNMEPEYAGVGFSHGAYEGQAAGVYYNELVDMVRSFQQLALPSGGKRLHFYTDQTPCYATATQGWPGMMDQVKFANERSTFVHCIGPRYAYPLRPADGIHHTADATCDIGVLEGYVKYLTLRKGYSWSPLRITSWSVSGNTVTLALSNPWGALTGSSTVVKDTTTLAAANGSGFRFFIGGVERTVSAVNISGMGITLTFSGAAAASGNSCELMYAYKRDTGVATDMGRAGAWGNIKQVGPANPLWNNGSGKTVDAWLCIFDETKTI